METIDLGLDFGSIFFRAAYMLDHEVVPIPISGGERIWSGAVFTAGPEAHKPFLFESLKSHLGLAGHLFILGSKRVTAADRVKNLLTRFKTHVEDYTGSLIDRVVIAVPGYYSEIQRTKIRQTAEAVGLQHVELLDDCQAAVLGYTTLTALEKPLYLLIFSMGFMGIEVNLVRLDQTACQTIANQGRLEPSGRDVDRLLMEWCVAEAERRDISLPFIDDFDQSAWREFREAVEEAKKHLGLGEDVQVTLPASVTGKFPLTMLLQVADFEAAMKGYVDQAMATVQQVLAAGQIGPAQVDKVLLVGGTTRLPSFQTALTNLFGPKLIQPREDLLARGAAIYAAGQSTPLVTRQPALTKAQNQSKIRNPKSEIESSPTPEAILAYAQTLADAGDYEAASEYLTQIAENIQAVQAWIEGQWTD